MKRLYANRMLRIFSPFWAAVIFTVALGAVAHTPPFVNVASQHLLQHLAGQGVRVDSAPLLPFQFQFFLFGVLAYRLYRLLPDGVLRSRAICWSFTLLPFAIVAFAIRR